MPFAGRRSAETSRFARRPLLTLALAAALTLGACQLGFRAGGKGDAFSMVGSAVLERPWMGARHAAGEADHAEKRLEEHDDGRTVYPVQVALNDTAMQGAGKPAGKSIPVALNPPWANCFVEYVEAGRPVLEEWHLRGDRASISAFRAWRQPGGPGRGPAAGGLRCAPVVPHAVQEVFCLECLSYMESMHSAPSDQGGLGLVARGHTSAGLAAVHAKVVDTFTELEQCFKSVEGGRGFCKSGQVVVPM